jgi:hypothetical protein
VIEKVPNTSILSFHAAVVDIEKDLGFVDETIESPGHNLIGLRVDGDQGNTLTHPLKKSFDRFRIGFARQTGSQS